MRWVVIALAVVGIVFVAFMLIGSNESREDGAGYEASGPLAWLGGLGGAPRLVDEPVRFPRNGDTSLEVARSCGTPARMATFTLVEGSGARIVYRCGLSPDPNCRGVARLCEQNVRLIPADGEPGDCNDDNVCDGEATLSIGPDGGRITIEPASVGGGAFVVELR